jgi:hypothetical protein
MRITLEMAENFGAEAMKFGAAGFPLLSKDQRDKRHAVCKACDEYRSTLGQCKKCGCFMALKTWIGTSECPLKKWLPEDPVSVAAAPRWYYEPAARAADVVSEMQSWAGTPFWANTRGRPKKGVRSDCVAFAEAVWVKTGACPPIQWPDYVTHNGGAKMLEVLLSALAVIPRLTRVWQPADCPASEAAVIAGDLLVGSSGRARHHVAMAADNNTVWHCTEQHGVCEGNRQDPMLSNYLIGIYRFSA